MSDEKVRGLTKKQRSQNAALGHALHKAEQQEAWLALSPAGQVAWLERQEQLYPGRESRRLAKLERAERKKRMRIEMGLDE